jgi:hypothetical protein
MRIWQRDVVRREATDGQMVALKSHPHDAIWRLNLDGCQI